jgi:tight adherence protein C
MFAALLLMVGVSIVLLMLSKDRYKDLFPVIDEKQYPYKVFLPAGLLILDFLGYKYSGRYDRKLLSKVSELYGPRNARIYLKVHYASKIVLILLTLTLICFFGIFIKPDITFALFGFCLICAVFFLSDRDLDKRIKKRRFLIRMGFPDFLNKLTLLINAGMIVSKAWEKAAVSTPQGPLREELNNTLADIKIGKPERRALEDFAKRCKTPEITRSVSIIIQNLRKGGFQIVSLLRLHTNECWEMRKNAARKYGEEASTKMLLPLTLMFLAILIIVAAPAVLSMRDM